MADLGEQKRKAWEQEAGVSTAIARAGGVASYLTALPGWQKAFELRDRYLRCIDEGTPGGLHLAGSGILLDMGRAAETARAMRVEAVTYHDDCTEIINWGKTKNLLPGSEFEEAKKIYVRLAQELGVPLYKTELKRPEGLHAARVIYYDGTGSFDPSAVNGLPIGFVISRRYLKADYALSEVTMALDVAFGAHGFGEWFTRTTPLWLVVLGSRSLPSAKLIGELEPLVANRAGRVKIDELNLPWIK